jgi:hypothetical protein
MGNCSDEGKSELFADAHRAATVRERRRPLPYGRGSVLSDRP